MKKNKLLLGSVLVILSAVIFGCMPIMTSVLRGDGMNSISIVLIRNLFALPVLAVLALIQNKSLKIPIKALPSMLMISLLGCIATPLLLYSSYTFLIENDSIATAFHFVYPAIVVLIGIVFFKEKLKPWILVSLILCVVGVCLFYDPRKPLNLMGAVLALLSGVTYAVYVQLLSVFRYKQVSGYLLSFYLISMASVALLIFCASTGQLTFPQSAGGWGMGIFFSLVVTVGAVFFFQKGTFMIGGQRASILSTMEPITSILVNTFLGIFPTPQVIIGSILVIAATIFLTVFDHKKSVHS